MRLEVSCEDRLGLTRELLDRLVEHNIDLRGIEIDTSGIIYLNFPELEFRDFQHLMPEIRRIPGVYDVKTIPYMPSEREHHEIEALLKALPDLVFSLDSKGRVTQANQAALTTLALPPDEVRGVAIASLVKGFSFGRWLESGEIKPQTCKLSLGGAGTWPQAQRMHRVLRQLPLEAIVLETDAPDIPPAGHAGERNSPELLPEICQRLADLKGIAPETLATASYRNSCELFGWR